MKDAQYEILTFKILGFSLIEAFLPTYEKSFILMENNEHLSETFAISELYLRSMKSIFISSKTYTYK